MDGTPNPITELRERYGLSQADLGAALGLPERYVDVLEMEGRKAPAHILAIIENRILAHKAVAHE